MGSAMTLFIVVSDEATFEEITLSDISYGVALAFITSAFVFYPIFSLMLRKSDSRPNLEAKQEGEKANNIGNSWSEFLKVSLKWGLILFILVGLTNYLTQNNFDLWFSLKYGFGGGVLAALLTRTLLIVFCNSKESIKTNIPEQPNVKRPGLFNWVVATISATFVFLMSAFFLHLNIYGEYEDNLMTVYFPTAILLGVAFGQWVRIRYSNREGKK